MPININSKGGEDFAPIPAGVHQGVCYGVVDIGTQPSKNPQFAAKRKIVLLFELPHERADFGERKNQPRGSSVTLTQSLNEKAVLRKMLKSWRGRDFSPEELKGFDPKVLVGINCQLNIVHESKGDKTYANITSIMPLGKGMAKVAQENKPLYFSLDDQDLTSVKFPENMPKWMQEKITFCEEVMAATGVQGDHKGDGEGWASNPEAEARHAEETRHYATSGQKPAGVKAAAPAPQEEDGEDV